MAQFKVSDKTVLVYDYGLFIELAIKLVPSFKRVLYYIPWKAAFPKSLIPAIGQGIPGVTKVMDFWEVVKDVDLFIFPDIYDGDLQVYLRGIGKRVWGSGMGENLEFDRWGAKQLLKKVGLPVVHTERIIGLDALRERLKQVKNKFIKTPKFRGDMETYQHLDYKSTQPWLDELAHGTGPRQAQMEFLLEDFLPGIEIAYDNYTIDGKFPMISTFGYEQKGSGYVGKVKKYAELPEPVRRVNEKLSETLKHYKYRNYFAAEMRIGPSRIPYVIDPCARFGSPPTEMLMELYKNWDQIFWYGAEGLLIEPDPVATYGAELLLFSEWSRTNWLEVDFPENLRKWIKFRNLKKIGNSYWIVPQNPHVGCVVAVGNSQEEVMKKVKERADQVKGYQLQTDPASFDKLNETIAEGKKYGVQW